MTEFIRPSPFRRDFWAFGGKVLMGGLLLIGLNLISGYSFVLFHTCVELLSIAIGLTLFLIMWNARKWLNNRYLLVLGTGLAAAGGLDLVHTLAYKGLNLFQGFDSNLPTQLWIAARYLQSLTMLAALYFLPDRDLAITSPDARLGKYPDKYFDVSVLLLYFTVIVGLLTLIFLRLFPVSYIEGQGLTPFKKISEYVICVILLLSLVGLWRNRLHFDRAVLYLLTAATGLMVLSELAFTFYVGVYDFSNLVGHYCKLGAFVLIYLAVIQSSLQRPYSILFRNLSQQTSALQKSEEQYRLLVENANDIVYSLTVDGVYQYVSPTWTKLLGYEIREALNRSFISFIHRDDLPAWREFIEKTVQSGEPQKDIEYRVIHKDGSYRWHISNLSIIKDGGNQKTSLIGIAHDITERKLGEEAMRSKEELLQSHVASLRLALEAAHAGVWEWVLSTNENVWSEELWTLYGLEPHSAAPSYGLWLNAVHRDDRAEVDQAVQNAARDGAELKVEWRVCDQDGTVRTLLCWGRPLRGPDGQIERYTGIVLDISERKRAEEALRERDARFRSLFNNLPMSGVIYRLIRNRENEIIDWEFQDINLKGAVDIQAIPSDLIGKYALEYFGEEVMRPYLDLCKEVVAANQPRHFETFFPHNNRYYLSVVFPMGTDFYANMSIDITERKRVEDALRESETKLQAILANSLDAIGVSRAGLHVFANPAYATMFGYQRDAELIGTPIINLIAPESRDIVQKILQDWNANWPPSSGNEVVALRKDGSKFTMEVSLSTYILKEEEYFLVILRDITVRKLAEEKIQADQVELQRLLDETELSRLALLSVVEDQKEADERIQQLNAGLEQRVQERTVQLKTVNQELESFSYSVSHDLRAPLRRIDGWGAVLLEDYQDRLDEQGRNALNRMRAETHRMGQMIDDILQLSRVTRIEMRCVPVHLSELAQVIIARLQETDPLRAVRVRIQPGLVTNGDPNLLEIMLTNLLSNAWKFTGKQPDAIIEFGQKVIDGSPTYFVMDNGAGFDMAYAQKLFGAFQRMHNPSDFPGTGIGLATVQRVIYRHGGKIWAEAKPDCGATFYFTLEMMG